MKIGLKYKVTRERLQKIISNSGILSRRKAELMINQKKVLVNGSIASIGDKADPELDIIKVNGYLVPKKSSYTVILVNKPPGIVSTCSDQFGRKTVLSLVPEDMRFGMYPVGRLDYNSRGAIILTNNGELALRLTHPRYQHLKTYSVLLDGIPTSSQIIEWEKGIEIDNRISLPAKLHIKRLQKGHCLLEVQMKEGRNRQIRRIAHKLGYKVIDLKRISIGGISLGSLKEGCWLEIKKSTWMPILGNGIGGKR